MRQLFVSVYDAVELVHCYDFLIMLAVGHLIHIYICIPSVSITGPSVPLTVKEDLTGTAFGAITAIQNIGLALFPLLIAAIYTASDNKYIPNVEYFFIGCAVTGAIFGFMLNVYDRRMGGMLNKVQRRIVSI